MLQSLQEAAPCAERDRFGERKSAPPAGAAATGHGDESEGA
jgi:hypothetical protein